MGTLYQASNRQLLSLEIKVLCGRKIKVGKWRDRIDTPDPYVKLRIRTAPNGFRRTKAKKNDVNPTWDEVFQFILDPTVKHTLEITLMDQDVVIDDVVDTQTFDLSELTENKTIKKTFKFRKGSEVDMEMKLEPYSAPSEMRHSADLCEDENSFLDKRKQVVFEAMKKLLGKNGPKKLKQVPTIAVLGSGGGFRAMVSLSGVFCALKDMGVLDCVTYVSGLSGSAWYLSTLYSHPDWPNAHPREVRDVLKKNVKDNWVKLLFTPSWMHKRLQVIRDKKARGQPVSFTDFFGYLIGDTVLKERKDVPKLSEQSQKVEDALVPLPLYTCVHVKKDVSAQSFCEWVEFSPYEIGMAKYGTFMKTEDFGSKFFCGKKLTPFPEPPLHYMQGIWGSAFTILFQRILNEEQNAPEESFRNLANIKEGLRDLNNSDNIQPNDSQPVGEEDSDDEEEEEKDTTDGKEKEEMLIADDSKDPSLKKKIIKGIVNRYSFLKTRSGRAGLVHNFLRGLQLTAVPLSEPSDFIDAAEQFTHSLTTKRIYVCDSGLSFNSPYPMVLRPQRNVDLLLSFDFSARKKEDEMPFEELLLAEKWARENKIKFPPINAEEQYKKHGMKEFYVFEDPEDLDCPVIVHFVLCNKTFKEQSSPGVPRETAEAKKFADFPVFEDPKGAYSTFNFHYPEKPFDRLTKLNEFNTLLGEQTIKDAMTECVRRRRKRTRHRRGRCRIA